MGLLEFARRAFALQGAHANNYFLLQEPASSGERITEETCWGLVPVYRALTMIGNDVGRMPLSIGVEGPDGIVSRPHAVADLLALDPNRFMSGFELRRTMTMQALRHGNACAQIVRSGRGEVIELVPMLPGDVVLIVRDREITYKHAELGELAPDEVLHLKAPGSDGLWGHSPIRKAAEALGLMRAMEKAGGSLYKNAGIPKLAFVHPGSLSATAQKSIVDSYLDKHGGPANAGRPLVLGEGMKIERINQSLEDQMWQVAREFSVQEVSRLFGVPVVYLSEHSRSTFASIVELTRTYWDGCLSHWTTCWSEEVRRKLLAPGERLVWDTRDLLKGSFGDQVSALRAAIEVGIMTQNEARERLGLSRVDSGNADELLRPANTLADGDQEEAVDGD